MRGRRGCGRRVDRSGVSCGSMNSGRVGGGRSVLLAARLAAIPAPTRRARGGRRGRGLVGNTVVLGRAPLPSRRARRALGRARGVLRSSVGQTAILVTPAMDARGSQSRVRRYSGAVVNSLELAAVAARGAATVGGENERESGGDDQQAGKERHFQGS